MCKHLFAPMLHIQFFHARSAKYYFLHVCKKSKPLYTRSLNVTSTSQNCYAGTLLARKRKYYFAPSTHTENSILHNKGGKQFGSVAIYTCSGVALCISMLHIEFFIIPGMKIPHSVSELGAKVVLSARVWRKIVF